MAKKIEATITAQVAHAFNRFGLGGRPDDAIPSDAVTWLTDQLSGTDPLANAAPSLSGSLNVVNAVLTAPPHSAQQTAARASLAKFFDNEQENAVLAAVNTTTPFRERLVLFWANHFAVQAATGPTMGLAGCFVRDAIRPYVMDTFANMLLAVMQHPAMLASLNNDVSIGPQSVLALRQGGGGINENLGRETLELFTVSVAANYTQADVDAMAYMLTGWTFSYSGSAQGFVVDSDMHQPGPQTLMGVTYPGTIFDAYSALQFLGTHPLTYSHLATKLVTHFVSDTPDPSDVATVAQALSSSNGSLTAAYQAIIGLASAWVPQTKLRTPQDFVIAGARAVGAVTTHLSNAAKNIGSLGQPIWQPPFPNGWSDLGVSWADAAQMAFRTNWTNTFCNYFKTVDPGVTANAALGALISPATTAMISRVSDTHDKLTILFCSPDFQRR